MKLKLDTSEVSFMVTKAPVPKEFKGEQQTDKDGSLKWVTTFMTLEQGDESDDGQIMRVVTAGEKPKVNRLEQALVAGLEVVPWERNGNHGISYRAAKVEAAKK